MRALLADALSSADSRVDSLLRNAGIVTIGVVLSGGFNYAFQLYMGRALGPEEYGVFGALFSLTYLVNIFSRGIRFATSRCGSELDQVGSDLVEFHTSASIRALGVGLVIGAAIVLSAENLATLLNVGSVVPVFLVAVTIPFSFLLPVNIGLMEGTDLFRWVAQFQVIPAATRLGVGILLVTVGWGINGAFGGIILGLVLTVLWSTKIVREKNPDGGRNFRDTWPIRDVYRYMGPAILAGFCFNVPGNVDVILVQHFASSTQAGYYTAASVVGKSLIFLTIGMTAALFPAISRLDSEGGADGADMVSLFKRGLGYSTALLGSVTLVYVAAPRVILSVLYGAAYLDAAPFVRWYALATLLFCMAAVVLNFELARANYRFVYLFAGMSVVEVGAMWTLGATPLVLIYILLAVNAALFAFGVTKVGFELLLDKKFSAPIDLFDSGRKGDSR